MVSSMTEPIHVIPDIHGQKAQLDRVLARIEAQSGAGARIVFLGDYVDRGPDSRGVLQTLIDGIAAGRNWTALRGNHDQLFLDFIRKAQLHSPQIRSGAGWLSENLGGTETLASYGIHATESAPRWTEATRAIPQAHRDFLATLPHSHETGDLFLCHAGIRPGVDLADQDPDDLTWIREPFLGDRRDHAKLIVHGHTAIRQPEHRGNRVNLDGGAGWGRTLQAAMFVGRDCWLLTDTGRVPLLPPDAARG